MNIIQINNYSPQPEIVEAGTSGSYGTEQLLFEFDSSWNGLTKSVMFFTKKNSLIKISLNAHEPVTIPQELTLYGGEYRYVVVGIAEGVQKVSMTGTLRVNKTESIELLEVPTDMISPAFSDFLLLYNEVASLADNMKIQLNYNETDNTVCWKYAKEDTWRTLASLSSFDSKKRIDNGVVPPATSHFLPKSGAVVYLDDCGSAEADGQSVFTPINDLQLAIAKLPTSGGKICIVSTYTNPSSLTIGHTGTVHISGLDQSSLFITSALTLDCNVSFSHLTIKTNADYVFFNAMGNTLAMLEKVIVLPPDTERGIRLGLRGGGDRDVSGDKKALIAIFSGEYYSVYAGGRQAMYVDSVIELHGGSMQKLCMAGDGVNGAFYAGAYLITNNYTPPEHTGSCIHVSSDAGGYVTYDSENGFVLYTPQSAIVMHGNDVDTRVTGAISVLHDTYITHVLKWDLKKTKNAVLCISEDSMIMFENMKSGDTATIEVSGGGLLKNYPTEGLPRDTKLEYSVTMAENRCLWSVCKKGS